MKKIITILAALILVAMSGEAKSSQQKAMEKEVSKELTNVSFAHFKEYQTITLQQELDRWTRVTNFLLNWDESFVAAAQEMAGMTGLTVSKSEIDAWQKESRETRDYHTALLNHLNQVCTTSNCNKVSFTIYQLTYVGMDKDGNKVHNHCYGRFNTDGKMIAFRMNDSTDWVVTGNFWSIPGADTTWKIPDWLQNNLINVNF